MSDFHFNEREFELAAKASVEQTLQKMMDRLRVECEGKSVEEAKARLAEAWVDATNGKITDPELTTYAKELAVGNRVIIRLQ